MPYRIAIERIEGITRAMRPRQWAKNGALFVGLIFAQRLFALAALVYFVPA